MGTDEDEDEDADEDADADEDDGGAAAVFLCCVERTGTGVAHWIGHKHHSKRLQRRGNAHV